MLHFYQFRMNRSKKAHTVYLLFEKSFASTKDNTTNKNIDSAIEIKTVVEKPGFPAKVPFRSIPISGSASFAAQQYGMSHQTAVFPNETGRSIPGTVFSIIGTNSPVLRARYKHNGICQTDARAIAMQPAILCGTEYTAVSGEMILLLEISNAKNIPATSSFSIRIIPFAISNFERFKGIENTE